jgi:glutamyl endopeptidase
MTETADDDPWFFFKTVAFRNKNLDKQVRFWQCNKALVRSTHKQKGGITMKKGFRYVMVGAALVLLLPFTSMAAGPNDTISDDGKTFAPPEASVMISAPYKGTGKEASAKESLLTAEEVAILRGLPAVSAVPPTGPESETILGPDSRMQIYGNTSGPARQTVLITFSAGRCTGWLIGPNTVVTAGHCVHKGGGGSSGWYPRSSYRIYPGYTGSSAPYGYSTAKGLYSVSGWTNSNNWNYDYGVIKLNSNPGYTVGWFGFQSLSSIAYNPTIINGYPGDKPYTQWGHADRVRSYSSQKIWYNNDTVGGMSGSAVWYEAGAGPYGIGIHAYGGSQNSATLINSAVFSNLYYWKNLP